MCLMGDERIKIPPPLQSPVTMDHLVVLAVQVDNLYLNVAVFNIIRADLLKRSVSREGETREK